ncbi:hypothetical protein SDC9_133117 [bioreactor metagenome]|uniref:Uncharacterized protein n=1 Tax=bioreactor metagenome TaxID=1076179 RepID=A0A645D9M1_9ZZZZ
MLHGKQGCLDPAVNVELFIDVGQVRLHRTDADKQLLGNLAIGQTTRKGGQDGTLSLRQIIRVGHSRFTAGFGF